MDPDRTRTRWMLLGLVLALGVGLAVFRGGGRASSSPPREGAPSRSPPPEASAPSRTHAGRRPLAGLDGGALQRPLPPPATLAWGDGPDQLGKPSAQEGQAETPVRLSVDAAGNTLVLDAVHRRLLRLDAEGGAVPVRPLPTSEASDFEVAADGTVLLLQAQGQGGVQLLHPDGSAGPTLPLPRGEGDRPEIFRSVTVVGEEVFVESPQGSFLRIGEVSGRSSPPALVPGRPTRDGRGFVSARIIDGPAGRVHLWVTDREPEHPRFSRELQLGLAVESLFLIDADRAGRLYLGLSLAGPGETGSAQLLCLSPDGGDVLGQVELSLAVPEETVMDATALDEGGIAYAVWTAEGVRVQRLRCP